MSEPTATDRLLNELNAYQGDDIWQDIILGLHDYDEAATDEIDGGQSDRFALSDGSVIRYDYQRGEWAAA
jgi:hypothetical protein